jgi:hypothetical protein
MAARFEGDFLVKLLDDGRNIRLESDLVFFDPNDVRWAAPKGAVVDGASIPQGFWSVTGGPFEGKYRNASIIHDWFCDKRTRTWQATHRVFYDGMIAGGVSVARAKLMYYAVWWGGPRWEERVSINTNLPVGEGFSLAPGVAGSAPRKTVKKIVPVASPGADKSLAERKAAAKRLRAMIKAQNLSLDDIEGLAEQPHPHGPEV